MISKLVLILPILALLSMTIGTAFAGTPEQNYQAGYNDGCQDAHTGNTLSYYNHSNGNHHSQSYNNGYNAAFNSCGGFSNVDNSQQNGANQNSNNREQAQSQGTSQHFGLCVTVFSGCSQTSGESAGLSN